MKEKKFSTLLTGYSTAPFYVWILIDGAGTQYKATLAQITCVSI